MLRAGMAAWAFLFICSLAPRALCQQPAVLQKKRPTIGLALEGGGALGLAHVGLLEWLAKNHIPVDYIAGTSMGGLVGGFFASGMTPDEIHHLVDTLEWNRFVTAETDDSKLSFRRKQDVRELGDESSLGLRHGLILPPGLNSGQQLDLLLSQVAAPYDPLQSFNDLPTPFRCVATDLASATAHVFDKGSFLQALRATMSLPGVFDPVIDGKHEYVDGGLLNNLPVDQVRAMGADVVIAVYLATDAFDVSKPQTLVTVLGRSLSAVVAANERHNIEAADLLVTVDLAGVRKTDFAESAEMMRRGFAGAQKKATILSKFALNESDWAQYVNARQAKRKTRVPDPAFVDVKGLDAPVAQAVRGYFIKDIGEPYDPERIGSQIEKAMANNVFAYMAYDLAERDGKTGLVIYVRAAASKPPALQPAVMLDGSDYRNSRFALAGRVTYADLGGFRSELRSDFIVGSTYRFDSEYYRPITPLSNWFVAPRVVVYTRPLDFYHRSDILAFDRQQSEGGGVDAGYQFGNKGELRVGYDASHFATSSLLGSSTLLPIVHGLYSASHVSYSVDRVDDDVIPHSGILGRVNWRWVDTNPGTAKAFPVFEGNAGIFQPLGSTSTVFVTAAGGTIFNHQNSGVPLFYLGGPQLLSAYGEKELYGNEFVLTRAGYLKQVAVISKLTNDKAYVLLDYEAGKIYGFADSTRFPMDVNAGVLMKTVLGPFFMGGSLGDAGHRKWYFELGPVF